MGLRRQETMDFFIGLFLPFYFLNSTNIALYLYTKIIHYLWLPELNLFSSQSYPYYYQPDKDFITQVEFWAAYVSGVRLHLRTHNDKNF